MRKPGWPRAWGVGWVEVFLREGQTWALREVCRPQPYSAVDFPVGGLKDNYVLAAWLRWVAGSQSSHRPGWRALSPVGN